MKVLGIVQWTGHDTRGQIAGVRPLFDVTKPEWTAIDAKEEFPANGEVFWPNAAKAMEGALVTFRADPNPGQQKHHFKVADPKLELAVFDLRRFGDPTAARAALVGGMVKVPGPVGQLPALILCADDVLVGPVEVARVATGTVRLSGTNLAKVASYSEFTLRSVAVSARENRLLRIDDRPPTGHVDWDDDAVVVRRALEIAVRLAKKTGRDTGQTKRQIEEAANALAAQAVGIDAQLERYRVDRALAVCRSNAALVAAAAPDLVALLRDHPAVQAQLDEIRASARAAAEQVARAEIEHALERELYELNEVKDEHERTNKAITTAIAELRRLKEEAEGVRKRTENAAKEIEVAIDGRVLMAIEKPFELLAEVSVLRPFLAARGVAQVAETARQDSPSTIQWSRQRGASLKEKLALRRALLDAARVRGVEPPVMMNVHAAVAARLLPVTLGPSALASMTAYAQAVCGGRVAVFHVSPGVLHPRELVEVPGGVVDATSASQDIDGVSLLVFEGANRAPIEASLLPLLQDRALVSSGTPPKLCLAATMVAGRTTVPVTPQIWSHAVAIYPEPKSPVSLPGGDEAKDVSLSSELLAVGDVPREQVDALIDEWPECSELKPALERFGAALSRLHDADRITEPLLQCLVLPYVVTALDADEQEQAAARVTGEENVKVLRRLRRGLC